MTRIYALLAVALLVTQVLSAPVAKQDVGERKAKNKEAANLEEELHKQAGEGKKDTPETSEPSPGHKPRGALGQLMQAAAEEEESQEEKAATTKTEEDAKLQNVIYSIYNNPEVLKALLRAGETKESNEEVAPPMQNGIKRDDEEEELRSNIIKKDGDDLYQPASDPNMDMLLDRYEDLPDDSALYEDDRQYNNVADPDYPDDRLMAEEVHALEGMEPNMNGIEVEDENEKDEDDSEDHDDNEEESTTKSASKQ
ncbi:nucleolin-like [Lineus longissimus]|uniref:nucleolin-like n=1 Tax=Lineus longissimus TaxID=88925 RepID=UPI002B4E4237